MSDKSSVATLATLRRELHQRLVQAAVARVCVRNPTAAAVDVHNAVDFVCPHLKPQTCLTAFAVKRRSTAASSSPHPLCSAATSCVLC